MRGDERAEPETERVHQQPLSRMGRRRFVKTLAAAGFGVATASHLSAGDFEGIDEEEVPIVYAVARDDPEEPDSLTPRTRTVAAGWYNDLQAALSARDTLDLADIDGVLNVYVVPGDANGGSASITVDVRNEEVAAQVAGLSEEVPIESSVVDVDAVGDEERETGQPRQRLDATGGPDVPGGVAVSDGESLATLAPALYSHRDGERFFATADHLYADGGEELSVLVDGQRRPLGRLHRRHEDVDVALIRPTAESEPSHTLYGSEPNRVVGQFSRIGLADLKARGAVIHKTGAMTGHTTGEIQAIDGVTCVYGDPCKSGQLKWGRETDFTDGDSGSVSYHPDPEAPHEQAFVCGLNNARTWWPGEDYIWGTGAYLLHEEFGYTF
jgi:hypothetical protein